MTGPAGTPGRILALGWATVELDRAAAELAPLLVSGGFRRTQASIHLGAYAWSGTVAPDRLPSGAPPVDRVILLEPSTEGRLAATLARHGEGWCATWVAREGGPGEPLRTDGPARTLLRPGPIGDERLLLDGPVTGPHRLVVEAATIPP